MGERWRVWRLQRARERFEDGEHYWCKWVEGWDRKPSHIREESRIVVRRAERVLKWEKRCGVTADNSVVSSYMLERIRKAARNGYTSKYH